MKIKHISFEILSKYNENSVISLSESRRIQEHIDSCSACAGELRALRRMMKLMAAFGTSRMTNHADFIKSTMLHIQNEKIAIRGKHGAVAWRALLRPKYAASIAACIICVVGLSLYYNSSSGGGNGAMQAALEKNAPPSPQKRHNAFTVLRRNKVKVLESSDSYVIGEVSPQALTDLTRQLTPHRVNVITTGRKPFMRAHSTAVTPGFGVYEAGFGTNDESESDVLIKVDLH